MELALKGRRIGSMPWVMLGDYAEPVVASLLPSGQPVSRWSAQGMTILIFSPRASLRCALGWYAAAPSALRKAIIVSGERADHGAAR